MESTLGVKCDLMLALRSQIFEKSGTLFYRHALEYLQSARSENKRGKTQPRKRLAIVDLFEGLWSVGTRFRH